MLEFGLIQWLEFFLYTFEAMPECKVAEMWIFGYITDHWKTFNLFSPPPNGDGVRGGSTHLFELYMKILVLRNYSKVAKPAYLLSLNF